MKMKCLLLLILLLALATPAFASSPPWTGDATYTFSDADPFFGENGIYDTATVNIIGGSFGSLRCYNQSTVNMSGGSGNSIGTDDYSVLHLSGGDVNFLSAINILYEPNHSHIHIYALNYQVNQSTYIGYYQLTGLWENGNNFDILIGENSWPVVNVHVIPEPCTLSMLAFGVFFLRKRSA